MAQLTSRVLGTKKSFQPKVLDSSTLLLQNSSQGHRTTFGLTTAIVTLLISNICLSFFACSYDQIPKQATERLFLAYNSWRIAMMVGKAGRQEPEDGWS